MVKASGARRKHGSALDGLHDPRHGRGPHAVLLELFTAEGVGTQVIPGVETKLRKAYDTEDDA